MNDKNEIDTIREDSSGNHENEKYQIILPCEVQDFGNFVSGLLGKPQVLKGRVLGEFEIGHQEISNIYHLVNHRVSQQNHGQLLHFSITVYYDNGTSITHNEIKKFQEYHPTEKCYPEEIVLSFTYLLTFPQNKTPEKQTIEVALSAEPNERRDNLRRYRGGAFDYIIEYTDRTWATDISGLLKNHGKVLLDEGSKAKEFFRRNTDEIVEYTGLIVFISTLLYLVSYSFNYFDTLVSLGTSQAELTISLAKHLMSLGSALIIMWLIIFSIRRYTEYNIHVTRSSYIILVEADKKYKTKREERSRKQWLAVLVAWLSSIGAGLITNYIVVSGYFIS